MSLGVGNGVKAKEENRGRRKWSESERGKSRNLMTSSIFVFIP